MGKVLSSSSLVIGSFRQQKPNKIQKDRVCSQKIGHYYGPFLAKPSSCWCFGHKAQVGHRQSNKHLHENLRWQPNISTWMPPRRLHLNWAEPTFYSSGERILGFASYTASTWIKLGKLLLQRACGTRLRVMSQTAPLTVDPEPTVRKMLANTRRHNSQA